MNIFLKLDISLNLQISKILHFFYLENNIVLQVIVAHVKKLLRNMGLKYKLNQNRMLINVLPVHQILVPQINFHNPLND